MKFTFLLSLMVMLCCLVCSHGSNSNENKAVDIDQEFEFEESPQITETPQELQQDSPPVKPIDDKNTKPEMAGFFERMWEATKRNPLMLVLLFVILVKNYLSSGKIKHIEGSLVRHINTATEWNDLMDESKKEEKLVAVDFFATW